MDYRLIILIWGNGHGTVTYVDVVENSTIKHARKRAYDIRSKLGKHDMVRIETVDYEEVGYIPTIPYFIDASDRKYQIFPDGSIKPFGRC